ncbi:hypothetical protein LZG04_15080 [Saccharothrix sp. S26]|uniref:hypothetical protein n=1 Tax=Saccharothrix sp. S26 TaxID=2907215 RepID=UPI001F2E7EAF|nr:hypothetical protein [Saccharothrix sp. S26]MCE6996116.1 hypothetical protein [Saccharothrix sp. S26]
MPATVLPTDNGREIPGLAALARTATRLHPSPGAPTVHDSHLGGPLLWPVEEPWPHCDGRLPSNSGRPEEGWSADHALDVPVALVGAAQFFRRDFPDLPFPEHADLLQVLFCPNEHSSMEYWGPGVHLVWRDSTGVTDVAPPPEPVVAADMFLPRPRVLNPCRITEYPMLRELPGAIKSTLSSVDEDDWPEVAQGSKLGGWTFWWQTDPWQLTCRECDADLRLLMALHTSEHDDDLCSCGRDAVDPAQWEFGREGALNIFTCPTDSRHPFKLAID